MHLRVRKWQPLRDLLRQRIVLESLAQRLRLSWQYCRLSIKIQLITVKFYIVQIHWYECKQKQDKVKI